jgi:NTE family protein
MINTLIFGGGGILGIAFIGAIKFLEQSGILKNITTYNGSSIGAISALSLALGYTPTELADIIFIIDSNKLLECKLINWWHNKCYGSDVYVNKILQSLIEYKFHKKDITFSELFQKTGKNLIINTTCISQNKSCHFNYINEPDMPIWLAVRMSISIPYIFPPVFYKNNYYVDACVACNIPLFMFDLNNTLIFNLNNYHDKKIKTIKTIKTKQDPNLNNDSHTNFLAFFKQLYKSIGKTTYHHPNILTINIPNYSSLDNIDNQDKLKLINIGYDQTKEFIINRIKSK